MLSYQAFIQLGRKLIVLQVQQDSAVASAQKVTLLLKLHQNDDS